jgi:hypothetical protein
MSDPTRVAAAPAFTREGQDAVPAPTRMPESELPRPSLDYDVRRSVWVLTHEYVLVHEGFTLTIPAGYTLDLASVPRVLWWLISSFELGMIGPLVHDFLYQCHGQPGPAVVPTRTFSRREVDRLFLAIMKREGVTALRRWTAYIAVRLFGSLAWRKHRR